MKLGQMISMDAGDLLPPELQTILARLRDQAYRMPPAQLDKVLKAQWGTAWRRQFRHFEAAPMAAASIVRATRSSGSRLWMSLLPAARASVWISSVIVFR